MFLGCTSQNYCLAWEITVGVEMILEAQH